jgi:hypothetical protein
MKESAGFYEDEKPAGKGWQFPFAVGFAILVAIAFIVVVYIVPPGPVLKPFTENFRSVSEDTLEMRGWSVHMKDTAYWRKHDENSGHLTLFTLKADNSAYRNVLIRKIQGDCFVAEVRLSDFVPQQNGQQAGIMLLKDADLSGEALSFSIGYKKLLIGNSAFANLAVSDSGKNALRIVKNGKKFSFLYTTTPAESYSFKEVFSQELAIEPKYIALYASEDPSDSAVVMPALFDHFSFIPDKCP